MPIKMKDVFNICENAEKVQWSISLGIIFDLAGEVCKKCNHGLFGLRSVVIANVVRKFQCVTDLGSIDII
jgi:hypothetical protein